MKKNLKNLLLGTFFIFVMASPVMVTTVVPTATAATDQVNCEKRFLGIPPWYSGLTNDDCSLKGPDDVGGIANYIWRIVLNVIEMAIVAAAYLSGFFILYGGFLFMTGGANPSQIERGRKTILNAVIGLVICMSAIAIINLVVRNIIT